MSWPPTLKILSAGVSAIVGPCAAQNADSLEMRQMGCDARNGSSGCDLRRASASATPATRRNTVDRAQLRNVLVTKESCFGKPWNPSGPQGRTSPSGSRLRRCRNDRISPTEPSALKCAGLGCDWLRASQRVRHPFWVGRGAGGKMTCHGCPKTREGQQHRKCLLIILTIFCLTE